ncbi:MULTISPECIES: NAD(P)/FAD-dependent oxidoreductase [unclassified Arcicella]|uniref:NAD(P)/FAD-dependent oxidoreductase n=1 Tax=unclassified Arcicella TaxID=2644986 RepID=UPI002857B007|nr:MULTISPECIES: NAD(P)/FAD-dependent oxidoreductase [unclassified Arcicella]MDR6561602.1 hypothetical protein [Arcicella sp. BE51]MDR6812382.1 hypothetical protein [Arcicella sp. BE140]MDR6823846.1 hypothetical protein [Arcicella sp. BE139]
MNNKLKRKTFIFRLLTGVSAILGVSWGTKVLLEPLKSPIKGRILGANFKIGHLLRKQPVNIDSINQQAIEKITTPILIVGAGVSGLAAARKLYQSGHKDFFLVDLEDHLGGNADAGKNAVTSYPWAAHYLPVANNDNKELLHFLEEHNVITGYSDQGLPNYNEYYLCQSPQERLFMKGHWQEGLIPNYGIAESDRKQINDFFELMNHYRQAKGADGRWAFTIPLSEASEDESFKALDEISMTEFLKQHHFDSEYLLWYVNYCCRDDYGIQSTITSAYAGIHYFAARKAKAANAESSAVLTWPEGNNFLANALGNDFKEAIKTHVLVQMLDLTSASVEVTAYNWKSQKYLHINAQRVILAIPQFIANRLLPESLQRNNHDLFQYAPWMVANITVNQLPIDSNGFMCWDNVAYRSPSLGYINACHQLLNRNQDKWVLTYYLPLSSKSPLEARKEAILKKHQDWIEEILSDLESYHPAIRSTVEEIDVKVWGHGMISPVVGFISAKMRKLSAQPIEDKIFFAHSDLSGISIFEEAFYQGNRVAEEVMQHL